MTVHTPFGMHAGRTIAATGVPLATSALATANASRGHPGAASNAGTIPIGASST
jgi:hypothetical protein